MACLSRRRSKPSLQSVCGLHKWFRQVRGLAATQRRDSIIQEKNHGSRCKIRLLCRLGQPTLVKITSFAISFLFFFLREALLTSSNIFIFVQESFVGRIWGVPSHGRLIAELQTTHWGAPIFFLITESDVYV